MKTGQVEQDHSEMAWEGAGLGRQAAGETGEEEVQEVVERGCGGEPERFVDFARGLKCHPREEHSSGAMSEWGWEAVVHSRQQEDLTACVCTHK